ncbi:hypothetical protein [Kutzneria sp. NPDC052558]|uniref:hypothetical protein n=1 Tax=Kutzneria sp. NPDC052558 TaxID=3364121 RepID=UPI0037CC76E4
MSQKRLAVIVLASAVFAICTATAATAAEHRTASGAAVTTASAASPAETSPAGGGTDW